MRILNPTASATKANPLSVRPTPPQRLDFTLRGKQYVFDAIDMNLFQLDKEEERTSVPLARSSFEIPTGPFVQSPRALVFMTTHACNLDCTYCFVSHWYDDLRAYMKFEVAKHALEHLVDREEVLRLGSLKIGFFGGEPMLNWSVIQQIVEFSTVYFAPAKISFGITTNATLVDEDKAAFMQAHNFSAIVSLDGPKHLHDSHRVGKDNSGSFDAVMRGITTLNAAGLNRITFRSTYLPDEIELVARAEFLNGLCDRGMGNWVDIEPAMLSEGKCAPTITDQMVFTKEQVKDLEGEYLAVSDWMANRYKNGKPARVHCLHKMVERLLWKQRAVVECGAGNAYMSVSPTGELFACHREMNSKIGDMRSGGIDTAKREQWRENRLYASPVCSACDIRHACGGGCRESHLGATGDMHSPDPVSCEFKMLYFKAGVNVLNQVPYYMLQKLIRNPVPSVSSKPATAPRKFVPKTAPRKFVNLETEAIPAFVPLTVGASK